MTSSLTNGKLIDSVNFYFTYPMRCSQDTHNGADLGGQRDARWKAVSGVGHW